MAAGRCARRVDTQRDGLRLRARALRVTMMSACEASSGRWMAGPPISYAAAATAASCAARSAVLRGAAPARRGRGPSGRRWAAAVLPAICTAGSTGGPDYRRADRLSGAAALLHIRSLDNSASNNKVISLGAPFKCWHAPMRRPA